MIPIVVAINASLRLRRVSGDVLDDLYPARIDQVLQLFSDLLSGLIAAAEDQSEYRQKH